MAGPSPATRAAARASAPAFAVCVWRMCGRSSRMIAVRRRIAFASWSGATSRWISGTFTTETPSRSATYAIESSPRARLPATRVVWYPRVSSPAARLETWIAGPPMFSRAMTRRTRIGSDTALTLAGSPPSPPSTLSRRGRPPHVRRPARRHRTRVSRGRRRHARSRRRSARACALPLRPARRSSRGSRTRATSPRSPRLREEHDVRLVVPLNDLDFPVLAREREQLAPALVLLPDADASARMSDKLEAHHFFVANGIPSPRSWAPEDVPGDARFPVLVKAREGFGSRNIHRAADRTSSRSSSHTRTCRRSCRRSASARSSRSTSSADMDGRCLNAIPRTMLLSKGGESIKGVSIKDRELIEHGARVAEIVGIKGPANVQCFREPDGSLPDHGRQHALRRRLPGPARRGRPLSGARARARARREARAATRRLRRGRRDDAVLLRGLPRARRATAFSSQSCRFLSIPWPCATSSPAPPASSARSSCARCSSAGTTRSAGTRSRTTTTRR